MKDSHLVLGLAAIGFSAACTTTPVTPPIGPNTQFDFTSFDGPGGGGTTVNGMNDDGDVIGFTTTTVGSAAVNANFIRHRDGTYTMLTISDPAASANGINNAGMVVGVANSSAFLLADATAQVSPLSPFGAATSVALGINDHAVIVGQFAKSATLSPGFVDDNGKYTEIDPTAASIMTFASAINSAGIVAGFYSEDGTTQHGFTYDVANAKVSLVTDPSTSRTQASPIVLNQLLSINGGSQVAGYYQTTDGSQYGLVYDVAHGTYVFLDDPSAAVAGGKQITQITGINDSNELAGFYVDAGGAQHGFIATPKS
jgi:hypothetical protein